MPIEYTDRSWSPFTGCRHTMLECPTADKCWARAMSKRFEQVCGGDFEPRFRPDRLDVPLHWRKPQRVAVCFLGDLFGEWNNGIDEWYAIQEIIGTVEECPQHQFLFLTKRPENLAQFNPWPANAWVGTSITGAETPERQAEMLEALSRVEGAGVRWVSYEPVLGPLVGWLPEWLDWIVIGAQTGHGAKECSDDIYLFFTEQERTKLWEKNNLARYLKRPLVQETP